jgi:hypothetical protein
MGRGSVLSTVSAFKGNVARYACGRHAKDMRVQREQGKLPSLFLRGGVEHGWRWGLGVDNNIGVDHHHHHHHQGMATGTHHLTLRARHGAQAVAFTSRERCPVSRPPAPLPPCLPLAASPSPSMADDEDGDEGTCCPPAAAAAAAAAAPALLAAPSSVFKSVPGRCRRFPGRTEGPLPLPLPSSSMAPPQAQSRLFCTCLEQLHAEGAGVSQSIDAGPIPHTGAAPAEAKDIVNQSGRLRAPVRVARLCD